MVTTTTTAAAEAGVTIATIRTWCRRGVVAARKVAGRWAIDTTSLGRRIAIGARRARKQATVTLDLTASITLPAARNDETPETFTPIVKRRIDRRTGGNMISVRAWFPLVAGKLASLPEGDRVHCMNILKTTYITITDTPDPEWADDPQAREDGQLRTTYRGEVPQVTISDVLDLAAQLRAQLAA